MLQKGKLSEPFEVHSGVRQSCILSPLLILIVVGDVITCTSKQRTEMDDEPFPPTSGLCRCLLFHKFSDIQDMIRSLEKEAASADLKMHCGKTKMLKD